MDVYVNTDTTDSELKNKKQQKNPHNAQKGKIGIHLQLIWSWLTDWFN